MTVKDILQKESNISKVTFFDKTGKCLDMLTVKFHVPLLLYFYGNKEVIKYEVCPDPESYSREYKEFLLYVLRITL